jgi:hypothetical protein
MATGWHLPALHCALGKTQLCPHAPQLALLVWVSVHVPEQEVGADDGQTQEPPTHCIPPVPQGVLSAIVGFEHIPLLWLQVPCV